MIQKSVISLSLLLFFILHGKSDAQTPLIQNRKGMAMTETGNNRRTILDGISIPPLSINEPPLVEIKTQEGPLVLIAPDHSLPFISINMHFSQGTDSESTAEAGTLQALVSMLQLGGTKNHSADEIQEELSRLGAVLKIGYSHHSVNAEITFLKRDTERVTELLLEILTAPRMEESRLEVIKDSMRTEIRQRNDNPSSVARRKIQEVLYIGKRQGYSVTAGDIDRISTSALLADLKSRLNPSALIIGISGDADESMGAAFARRAADAMRRFTGSTDYKKPEVYTYSESAAADHPYRGKIVLVETAAQQAVIYAAADLPEHSHPDFFALQTGNYILGGGSFNSRLMKEIRAKRGLAYYASSGTSFSADYGRFTAASGTRLDKTAETLSLMLSITKEFSETVTEEELSLAKDAIINSIVFQFEDPARFVEGEIRFRLHRMPENYLSMFPGRIRSLTVEDIQNAWKRHLRPENILIVVAGPASLKEELEKIRPVVTVGPETPLQ